MTEPCCDDGPPGHSEQEHHDASACFDQACRFDHPNGGPFPHPCDRTTTELRRDHIPMLVCMCGHGEAAHDLDKKAVPCSVLACGCLTFRLGQRRWRVTGWEIEPVE